MAGNRARIALIALLVGLRSAAMGACPVSAPVVFPPACVGVPAVASARLCFGETCELPGIVNGVDAPGVPFEVTAYHLDGIGEPQTITEADFPVIMLSGQTLVAELRVTLSESGRVDGGFAWRVADLPESTCPVVLRAEVPACAPASPSTPCLGAETCVAGACVPAPLSGTCDDGDPCTVGDACADGRCVPDAARSCDDGVACTIDRCTVGRGCDHEPVDSLCSSDDACATAVCDPTSGCGTRPITGPSCDDGETCTVDDACIAGRCVGRAVGCDDHVACTQDSCKGGACVHTPMDARCDRGQCVVASCRPDAPDADREGCIATPTPESAPCTDDGVACTDDVCTDGFCLHVPVDSRCGTGDTCTQVLCTPDGLARDEAGCTTTSQTDGCPEDGDACSNDRCQDRRCVHEPVAEWVTCSPVQPVFRKALALAAAARGLNARVGDKGSLTTGPSSLAADLDRVATAIDRAALVLAGKIEAPAVKTGAPTATPGQLRARAAFREVLLAPHQLQRVVRALGTLRIRLALGRDVARDVRRRGRVLLRGAKSLKRDLKRLQLVSQTFAR